MSVNQEALVGWLILMAGGTLGWFIADLKERSPSIFFRDMWVLWIVSTALAAGWYMFRTYVAVL